MQEAHVTDRQFLTSKGIEASAISPNNVKYDFDLIMSSRKIMSPDEITYGGEIYCDCADQIHDSDCELYMPPVDNETDSVYIEETESVYIEPEHTEPVSSSQNFVGYFDITAYTWTGNTMANGEYPYEGCVATCDFPLGTVLYLEGIGAYVVKDVCPTSGVIDIYMDSYDSCVNFGRQYTNVYVVD